MSPTEAAILAIACIAVYLARSASQHSALHTAELTKRCDRLEAKCKLAEFRLAVLREQVKLIEIGISLKIFEMCEHACRKPDRDYIVAKYTEQLGHLRNSLEKQAGDFYANAQEDKDRWKLLEHLSSAMRTAGNNLDDHIRPILEVIRRRNQMRSRGKQAKVYDRSV